MGEKLQKQNARRKVERGRRLVAILLQKSIRRHETYLEVQRKLLSQIDTASPFLIKYFAEKAGEFPDLVRNYVFNDSGYFIAATTIVGHCRDPIWLDEFLHGYIIEAQQQPSRRRDREDGSRPRDED